jgi:hypothetical protein
VNTLSWQLILYGRTLRADRWWRVRPRSAALDWLNDVVTTTTSGGEGLEPRPRYVLAQRHGLTLVGGSGRASLLSETMNSDGSRPLYTFVGWLSREVHAGIPTLQAMEMHWANWATEEYNAWMPLDWERHQSDLRDAHEPPLRSAPWTREQEIDPAVPFARAGESDLWRSSTRGPSLFSYDDRFTAWQEAAGIREDTAIVVCLPRTSLRSDLVTHVIEPPGLEKYAPTTANTNEDAAAPGELTTVADHVARADITSSMAPASTPADGSWAQLARPGERSRIAGEGTTLDTDDTAHRAKDGGGVHNIPGPSPIGPPPPAAAPAGQPTQPVRPATRRRTLRQFVEKLKGTEGGEAPGPPPHAAGKSMANDLEYWQRRQDPGMHPPPPKRTNKPLDSSG